MVGSLLALITNTVFLVTQPLSMIRLLWQLCVNIVHFLTLPWYGLFKFIFSLYVDICWRLIVWGAATISIPIRLFTALQREKLLEAHLYELQTQLEGLSWEKKDLEQRLEVAIKKWKSTESLLSEIEEEQDRAIEKLRLLEIRVREVEDENLSLREIEERSLKAVENVENGSEEEDTELVNSKREHQSHLQRGDEYGDGSGAGDEAWKFAFERRARILCDYVMGKERSCYGSEKKIQPVDALSESRIKSSGHFSFPSNSFSKTQERDDEVISQWRGVALAQSTFSACLSLLVGMIAWEAQDPCIPLVIALFTVVGMSLKSVVQFFSRIENRPGSDAVALLSFNWFILGTLASPTLPNVARLMGPLAHDFGRQIASWFGFSIR